MKKRWTQYQVAGKRYERPNAQFPVGHRNHLTNTKLVSDLTEQEAKDELCDSIALIEKLLGCSRAFAQTIRDHAEKQHYTT